MNREEEFEKNYPFTNFNQFGQGRMDLRVFDQNTWWVSIEGKGTLLEELNSEQLTEILNFLFNKAEYFHEVYTTNQLILMVSAHLEGSAPDGIIEIKLMGVDELSMMTPHQWLASTALMRKINKLLD